MLQNAVAPFLISGVFCQLLFDLYKAMLLSTLNFIKSQFFSIAILAVLYFGWSQRDNNYLIAETGAGYILGIVGASLMIILLLYPLSKRVSLLTRLMPARYWFAFHMFLGIIGPILILFHSNFKLGSINSSIALFSMLLVAGSGVIGRYIYTHIHHGLYGARLTLKELKQKTENEHTELLNLFAEDKKLNKQLNTMEEKVLRPYPGLLRSLLHVFYLAIKAPLFKRKVLRLLTHSYQENNGNKTQPDSKAVAALIKNYMQALRQNAAFRVYERLFSLWHVLHLPLFFMMLITAIIHIFAVHMY